MNQACVVVLGCGHLCLCYGCAVDQRQEYNQQVCPKCKVGVVDNEGKLQMQLIS